MSWRERAERALGSGDNRDDRDESPSQTAIVPNVPNVPPPLSVDPARVLKAWHKHLSNLEGVTAPACLSEQDWMRLCDDARWLYESHAGYAVRNGWGAQGLFGVRLGMPHAGGLAQFLRGSRQVVLEGPRAWVTSWRKVSKLNAECGHGLPLLWEL